MDVKIPEIGESILEALIANWLVEDGAAVNKDDIICELETDKINVELTAEAAGVLHIVVAKGETVQIGTVIATIEEGAGKPKAPKNAATEAAHPTPKADKAADKSVTGESPVNPSARQLAREKDIALQDVEGSGRQGRITRDDVMVQTTGAAAATKPEHQASAAPETPAIHEDSGRPVTREAMTPIRQRIAARLLEARQQTAMLTTFNDADMTMVKELRKRRQDHFTKKHGIKLGLMSFFVKACVESLKEFPAVNARIDGGDIVYHHYYDIGIAVGTDRGLVVPVLRDADQLTFAEIEQGIADLAAKANARKLSLADLEGGTFTISNGGIYGSVLSTPIINPPQCGVLGMHAIQDRPVVRDGEIVVRPIMNLALSYDHRLIDGREAVGFLKLIKDYIEDPSELLLEL